MKSQACKLGVLIGLVPGLPIAFLSADADPAQSSRSQPSAAPAKVSYYRDIRPILQANCQGCHQPAKSKGGYVMTEFKRLLAGGDNEGAAIVPGNTEKSAILKMITPQDGEVRMPKGKTPLMENEVALIRSWIQQGAQDDTPADAKRHYDAEHPPVYSRPPVIASLDFSPDGKLLAVAGFHEVLLYEGVIPAKGVRPPSVAAPSEKRSSNNAPATAERKTAAVPGDGQTPPNKEKAGGNAKLVARLIGLSERV